MTSHFLIPDIKEDEGFRSHAYPDPLSGGAPWSVGYGATGPGIGPSTVWTQSQAEANLALRVSTIVTQLTTNLPWFSNLSDLRQDVLVNMTYNLGVEGLLGFHQTLSDIKAGEWQAAHDGMLASLWARQVPNRAKRLAEQMLTNTHEGPVGVLAPAPTSLDIPPLPPAPMFPQPPIPLTPTVPQLAPAFTPAPVASTPPTVATVATPARVGAAVALTGVTAGATAMASAHIVNLTGLVDAAFLYLVTPIVLGIVVGLATSLAKLLNVNIQSALSQRLLAAAENGAAAMVSKAQTAADEHATVTTKSEVIAGTLNYINNAVPTAVKGLGLATPAGQAHLANLAEAQVQKITGTKP